MKILNCGRIGFRFFNRDSIRFYYIGFMNKNIFYWLIIFVSLCSCTSKTIDKEAAATNDSIRKYLGLAGNKILDSIHRNKYNYKAFLLMDLSKNDTLTRFYINTISYNYLDTKHWRDFKETQKILFDKSIIVKDTLNLARYYRYKGGYFKENRIYDSAYYYYIKAARFYKKTNDQYGLAVANKNKCQMQFRFDDYTGADLTAQSAYNYFKNTNFKQFEFDVLITLGNSNHNLRNYKKAIEAFKKAMFLVEKYNLKQKTMSLKATCLNNIGNAYREQKKFGLAMHYLNLALKEKDLINEDPVIYGYLLNNLSYCKLQLKDYSGFPNLLFKSIDLLNYEDDGIKETTVSYVYLSNYYHVLNDSLKAQLYADKALKIAKKFKSPYYFLTALSNAGSVNSKKAPQYIKEYHEKNDSLQFIERNARNQYYKIQLETDEITQEKDKAINQRWIVTAIAAVVILFVLLLLVITRQRAKQKELQLQQEQQKANEDIYDLMLVQKNKEELARQSEKKRIALELHDGVMNRLASTRLNLNVLTHKNDTETIKKCLTHITGIYEIEKEIRNIAHDLTLVSFTGIDNSFVTLLNDFIKTQNETASAVYNLEMDETINWEKIPSALKMNLFRIIQEASHNINKFAQAENATISFLLDESNICLLITDNGRGFDAEAINEGIGLKNIKQRVEALKGKLVIQSIRNKSTAINISIPFHKSQ